jgi:hypothetical protein
MANPRGQQRDKPYRDALRMEQASLDRGEIVKHPRGSLRSIAQARLLNAANAKWGAGDAKEIADRLDGRVPQAIVGDDEHPPVGVIVTGVVRAQDVPHGLPDAGDD